MEKEINKKNNPVYSETAYDDAFRTMEGRCDDLLIPFVSHMFKEVYGNSAVIKRLRNEHFVEHEDRTEEKRVTDSNFEIIYNGISKRYHLECESKKYDGTILVRIFEYDSQIAKNQAEGSLYKLKVNFPNSGLLLLRGSAEAPDHAEIEISMPDDRAVSYHVPIVKMSDYTVDDIFREKLFMLIPFYIFNYERQLPDIDKSEDDINRLLNVYSDVFDRLENELRSGNLSALSYSAIIRLTYSVAYKLTMKQDNVRKKVGDVMGGKVLDLPEFILFDQAKAEAKAELRAEAMAEVKAEAVAEVKAEARNEVLAEFAAERKRLEEEIAKLQKRIEELESDDK